MTTGNWTQFRDRHNTVGLRQELPFYFCFATCLRTKPHKNSVTGIRSSFLKSQVQIVYQAHCLL